MLISVSEWNIWFYWTYVIYVLCCLKVLVIYTGDAIRRYLTVFMQGNLTISCVFS